MITMANESGTRKWPRDTSEKIDIRQWPRDTTEKNYVVTEEEKAKSRYSKLVFEFPKEDNEFVSEGDPEDFVIHPQAFFRGARNIPGASFNCSFQIFVKPYCIDRVQHVHPDCDEYLIFLGASFPNVFNFDAHIELTLGKGKNAETYIITKPTIVRFPRGLYHCPLDFKEINKPVLFLAANMGPMFGGLYDLPDGKTKELWYNGPLPCKYDAGKKCDSCGACINEKWQKE
jgi:hypothetical protein